MRTEVLKKLQEETEEKYQKFSAKLLPPQIDLLGVRIPKLRQIAKEIAKRKRKTLQMFLAMTLNLFLPGGAKKHQKTEQGNAAIAGLMKTR